MSVKLPPEIEISERDEVARFRLPARQIGPWRWIGWLPLLFGLIFAVVPLSFALQAVNFKRFEPCSLVFVAFTIPFIWGGLQLARVGLLILAANSEIELRDGQLVAIERWGPVTWTRQLPLADVRKFVVQGGAAELERGTAGPAFLHELAAILVETETDKKALLLAPAFPPQLLLPLAEELAQRCNVAVEQREGRLEKPAIEVKQVLTPEDAEETREEDPQQPDESDIVVEEAADGVTLKAPAAGVWAGSKGLLFFSVLWNGLLAVITAAILFGNDQPKGKDLLILVPFLGLFWAVGLGLLLGAINMGKRRAVLAVVGDRLLALQTGIFGGKRGEWRRDELLDIRSGPSGVEVNDEPVMELQIVPLKGKKFGMLSERSEAELRWVAAKLRHALRFRSSSDGGPFREIGKQPDTSDVVCDQRLDGVTLNVPPAGLWSGSKGLLIVALGWNGFVGIITAILVGVLVSGQTEVWIGLLFLSVFWLIGLALLVGAIHMGTRRAVLAVVGEELLIMQTGIFGKKEHRWTNAALEDVRTGPSGMSVNGKPVLELHVVPKLGPKTGMLAGRDEDELAWLATVLRRNLKLPRDAPPESEAEGGEAGAE